MSITIYSVLILGVAAIVTMATRYIPFIIFDRGQEVPAWINYLGKVLPPAVMSLLIIYCVRSVDIMAGSHGIPELIAILATIALHAWRRNTLLSICLGTFIYMMLIRIM